MLSRLHIENFALLEKITLEFSPHLNVLTGETGAGKSLLIDAIRFVLGERVDIPRVHGKLNCIVEAVFEVFDNRLREHAALASFLDDGDEMLILRKEASAEGKTRAFINNRSVNNSSLKEAGALLLDIHGQYDHQQLLDASTHLTLIDQFAKTAETLAPYGEIFAAYQNLKERQRSLQELEQGREREMDLLKYQIDELERAGLIDGEDEELKQEQIRLVNSEKLYEMTARILGLLNDEDNSVSELLAKAGKDFSALTRLDPSMEEQKSNYETAQLNIEEMIRALKDYQDSLSFEPGRLEEIEKRLDVIDLMKRKYGNSVPEVLEFLEASKKKYDNIVNRSLYEKEIDLEIGKLMPKLRKIADECTEKRQKAASALKKTIEKELKDLEIPNARFDCQMEKTELGASGQDKLEFMVSLNPGEPLLPLRKIVSAGEVSRIMLAMKKALMKIDPIGTLIFDEIDANIGGRLGQVTGQKLKEIAGERQVLLITHLPQIASFADKHFKVTKAVRAGKTVTEYQVLEGEPRVRELAQMMSGKKETEISKKHAEEMLKQVTK